MQFLSVQLADLLPLLWHFELLQNKIHGKTPQRGDHFRFDDLNLPERKIMILSRPP